MSQLQLPGELPRTKPTLALESCADFFDRDFVELMEDVEDGVIKWAWNIAEQIGDGIRKEVRVYAPSAWAFCYNQPMPKLSEEDVYRIILPSRDIRSTELQRILACSHQHIHVIKQFLIVTQPPRQEDGPNSYCKFSRESIVAFLRSRRIS
ncbi:MAG TPA: hypothetical protein VGO57_02250 [Verrucomicrobiae bacterium]|jgi:hypothetical protein